MKTSCMHTKATSLDSRFYKEPKMYLEMTWKPWKAYYKNNNWKQIACMSLEIDLSTSWACEDQEYGKNFWDVGPTLLASGKKENC